MKNKLFTLVLFTTIFIFSSCQKEPTASFTVSSTSVNVGETVTFTNTSINANSYLWDFGDGGSSITESPSHIYDTGGKYTVTLTAFSKNVNKQDKSTKEITVSAFTPTVTTITVTSITHNSANSGGNVTYDGGATVTARGVCWSTSSNPTISNYHTTDGSGTGTFTSSITGLADNTTYYVRAYATNSVGTSYGNQIFFTTTLFVCGNLFTDSRDGQTYNTLQIGTQCWMAENLNYVTGNSWCYGNNSSNCDVYGRLYDWVTACNSCPSGWHLPTDAEWTVLTDYLGGESVAGGKMKEAGFTHWNSPNTGATNSSGFTALPGGRRDWGDGAFNLLGNYALFWSATEIDASNAWSRSLYHTNADVYRNGSNKSFGFSVRCVKD